MNKILKIIINIFFFNFDLGLHVVQYVIIINHMIQNIKKIILNQNYKIFHYQF